MERTVLRIALLVMLFVLLSADYSSLVSTVFTALGGSVVAPTHSAAAGHHHHHHRKVPTAPGDLGPLRRQEALHDEDEEDDDDVEDVFDFGGSTAKLFSEYL